MIKEINEYLETFEDGVMIRFNELYELIRQSTENEIVEKLWAKLPTFCVGDKYIRLIPFKDHININLSSDVFMHLGLKGFKITPKGMLPIYHDQEIPKEILIRAFSATLN